MPAPRDPTTKTPPQTPLHDGSNPGARTKLPTYTNSNYDANRRFKLRCPHQLIHTHTKIDGSISSARTAIEGVGFRWVLVRKFNSYLTANHLTKICRQGIAIMSPMTNVTYRALIVIANVGSCPVTRCGMIMATNQISLYVSCRSRTGAKLTG